VTDGEAPGDTLVIAIDGPSGTGKSSVAREVARRLGAGYLDTGAMYRALTVAVLRDNLDPADIEAVAARAENLQITIDTDPDMEKVVADGCDVTQEIRSPEATASVSAVSAIPAVRRLLLAEQRRLARGSAMVVEGRDIGTVVFPSAHIKIYLSAAPAARATRRADQLGITRPEEIAALAESLRARDEWDSTRAESPLRPAPDAVLLDSTQLSKLAVVEAILAEVRSRAGSSEVRR